eukprot:6192619-Pleurochrysis_carterae.AAC.1
MNACSAFAGRFVLSFHFSVCWVPSPHRLRSPSQTRLGSLASRMGTDGAPSHASLPLLRASKYVCRAADFVRTPMPACLDLARVFAEFA